MGKVNFSEIEFIFTTAGDKMKVLSDKQKRLTEELSIINNEKSEVFGNLVSLLKEKTKGQGWCLDDIAEFLCIADESNMSQVYQAIVLLSMLDNIDSVRDRIVIMKTLNDFINKVEADDRFTNVMSFLYNDTKDRK